MKNTKRFLAVLLVLVMVVSCLPMTALAAEKTGRNNSKPAKRSEDEEVITATWTQMPEDGDAVVLYSAKDGVIMAYSAEAEDDGEYITAWNQNTEVATVEGTKLTAAWDDAGILYALDMGDGTWAFVDEYEYDYNDEMYCLYNDGDYVGTIGDPTYDEDFCYYELEAAANGYLFKNVGSGLYLTIGSDGRFYDTADASKATALAFYVVDGGEEPVDPVDPGEDDEVITATWTQMPEDGDCVVLYSAKDGVIMAYSADTDEATYWNQNTEAATVEGTKLTAAYEDAGTLYAIDCGDGIWAFIDEYSYNYYGEEYCLYNDGYFVGTIGDPEADGEYCYYELELTTTGCLFKNVGSGLYLTIGSDGLFYDTEKASEATPLAFYVVDGVDPIEPIDPGEDEYITAAWTKLPEDGDPVVFYSAKNGTIMAWSFEGEEDEEGYYVSWNQGTEEATLDGYTLTAAYDDAGVFYAVDNGDGTWIFVDQFYYDYFELESCLYNDGEFVGTCGDPEYDGDYVCYELEAAADGYLFKNVGSGLYLTIGSDGLFYDTADASKATPLAFYVVGGEEPVEPTDPTDPIETDPIETEPVVTEPIETEPTEPVDPCEGYTDIDRSSWYHEAADFVLARGIMGSTKTDAKTFEPYTVCTRSMIATMLYSLEDKPAVTFEAKFPDVKQGQWFTDAVMWAYQNGVVTGYDNGNFGPNDKVTREQMAVILKAYAEKVKGIDTSKTADLSKFADAAKVTWSKPYITWAVAEGLLSGKAVGSNLNLDPQGNATRAEVAAIMRSFITNIIEAAK